MGLDEYMASLETEKLEALFAEKEACIADDVVGSILLEVTANYLRQRYVAQADTPINVTKRLKKWTEETVQKKVPAWQSYVSAAATHELVRRYQKTLKKKVKA